MRVVKVLACVLGALTVLAVSNPVDASVCSGAKFGKPTTKVANVRNVYLTYDSTIKNLTGAIKWKTRDAVVAAAGKWNSAPCQSSSPIQFPLFTTFGNMNLTRVPGFTEASDRKNDYLDVKIGWAQNSSVGCATYSPTTSRMTLFKTFTKNGVTGSCPLGEVSGFLDANPNYNGSWIQDMISMIAHELGHSIGLGDNGVSDIDGCIMSGLKEIGGAGNRRYRKPADNISLLECRAIDQLINPLIEIIDECAANPSSCTTNMPGGGGSGPDVIFPFDPYEEVDDYDFPIPDIDLLDPIVTVDEIYCIDIPVSPWRLYYTCDGSPPVDGKGC